MAESHAKLVSSDNFNILEATFADQGPEIKEVICDHAAWAAHPHLHPAALSVGQVEHT